VRLLSQLVKAHFMLKPLHQEANRKNPGNDLSEWNRIVKNADAQKTVKSAVKLILVNCSTSTSFVPLKGKRALLSSYNLLRLNILGYVFKICIVQNLNQFVNKVLKSLSAKYEINAAECKYNIYP